jgi:uncharacterized protein YeaO (DUF488 family)
MRLDIEGQMAIRLKRVYDPPSPEDGFRVLVERLWPRGMTKERAKVDLWIKETGASPELRRWYSHEPLKWEEFRRRYFRELDGHPEPVNQLKELMLEDRTITFLFSTHDLDRNNAVALKEYLEAHG